MKKRTTKPTYKVESVIICDDARQEVTGKEILIGVYNSVAYVAAFPAGFSQLFFRIAVRLDRPGNHTFAIAIEEEGTGRSVYQTSHGAQVQDIESPSLLGFQLRGFIAEKPTTLLVKFGLDSEPETIATFKIRHPINEEERSRLSK
jgi:hypothetical protein